MHTQISIPVNGEALTGDLFTASNPRAVMLICHGWTSNNTKYLPLAERLAKRGITSLAINLRGHGNSPYSIEKYSRQDHLNDLTAAIDYLKNLKNELPLIVLGKSYGGYLAAITTTKRKVDFLILSQPALYPDADFSSLNAGLIRRHPDIFRSTHEAADSNIALKAINGYTHPILIILSEHDEEVKLSPQNYIDASRQNENRTVVMLRNCDHPLTKPEWKEDFYRAVIQWISEKIGS